MSLYFYLDWPSKTATVTKEKPERITFESAAVTISLQSSTVVMCGNFEREPPYIPPPCYLSKRTIPLVKSNIQKCVRRNESLKAVSSAWALIRLQPSELLRRLPIIFLEDVTGGSPFTICVWLMMAVSKGFSLTKSHYTYLMSVVYALAECSDWDVCSSVDETPHVTELIGEGKVSPKQEAFLWALAFRRSYGGLGGDMKMLNYYLKTWSQRFLKGESLPHYKMSRVNIDKILECHASQILTISCDFHVCPVILIELNNSHPQYSVEDLQKCIWLKCSGIRKKTIFSLCFNKREGISEVYEVMWKKIKRSYLQIADFYLSEIMSDK
jgi:hypothetical protein